MSAMCQQGRDAATRTIQTQYEIIVAMAPSVRALDPDGIHDMRVASRRLRMALDVYRPYLPKKARKALRNAVKRITRLLGNRRELDVMVAMLREHRNETRSLWQRFMDHAIEVLDKRRDGEAEFCQEAAALADGDTFAAAVAWVLDGVDAAGCCLNDLARKEIIAARENARLARKRWRKSSAPEDLHQVRIELKHLRYACEFHGERYGEPMAAYIKQVKEAQSVLGEWNDCRLLEDMVVALGNAAGYTLAQGAPLVAEAYGNRAVDLAGQFPALVDRLLGKATREDFEALLASPEVPCCRDAGEAAD